MSVSSLVYRRARRRESTGGTDEDTHVVSASNCSSRLGSGSNVVISHVVVGPVASSALHMSQRII